MRRSLSPSDRGPSFGGILELTGCPGLETPRPATGRPERFLKGRRRGFREDGGARCCRRTGVGADGILRVSMPTDEVAAIRMQYWNADGSLAEMCGNGLRCVAQYVFDRGMTDGDSFSIETQVGRNRAQVLEDGQVRAELGPFEVQGVVTVDGLQYRRVYVGNPHAVVFVDEPEEAPGRTAGPKMEHHPEFPDGVNVEFATIEDGTLRVRVWERGAGETRACGTGAAAVVAAASAKGDVASSTTVDLPGGRLYVELLDGVAWITGPAKVVFTGTVEG